MSVESTYQSQGLTYESFNAPDQSATLEEQMAKITMGADIPLKTTLPGETFKFKISKNQSQFGSADELKAFLQDHLGPTTEIKINEGDEFDESDSFEIELTDSERTMEQYEGGIIIKNSAGEAEAGLAIPPAEESEIEDESEVEAEAEPETPVESESNTPVSPHMQVWQDLADQARAELEKDPNSTYWKGMLDHVEATLAHMRGDFGSAPEESSNVPTEEIEETENDSTDPINDTNFNGKIYSPNSQETIDLFYNAAVAMGMTPEEAETWANSPALHEILARESNGIVGVLNYSYGDAGGFNSTAEGREPHLEDLRNGISTTWSSASGLGQLKLENVELYYPSGVAGIGDPLEEAVGMLGYIKAAYGTPEEALNNHFKTGTPEALARGWDGY